MSEKKKPLFQRCGSVSHIHSIGGVRPNEDGDIPITYDMMPEGYPRIDPKGGTETIFEWTGEISTLSSGQNRGPSLIYADVFTEELVLGETYIVTFDGTDYECTSYGYNGRVNNPSLGNSMMGGADEDVQGKGEPFLLTKLVNYFFCYADSAGEHSYAIKKYVPAPVPMAEEFVDVDAIVTKVIEELPDAEGGSF